MSNYSIHFSPTGGTKKVADILANALRGEYQEIELCRKIQPMALNSQDVCLISVPSYGGRVPAVALERLKVISANGAFVCTAAVAAVAEHSIFRQFATGRPDEEDTAQLTDFAQKIQQKLDAGIPSPLNLAGSHGTYQKYGGVPFKPEGNKKCISCGLCAKACPVDAIDFDAPRKTNKEKCISCMRCVGLCPQHARDLNALIMQGAAVAMSKHLSGHKENHLFL